MREWAEQKTKVNKMQKMLIICLHTSTHTHTHRGIIAEVLGHCPEFVAKHQKDRGLQLWRFESNRFAILSSAN